mgnify:CR=1 FL=1
MPFIAKSWIKANSTMDTFIFHNLFFNLNGLVGGSSLFHIYIVNSVQCDSLHKGGTNFFAKEEPYEQALIEVQSHFRLISVTWFGILHIRQFQGLMDYSRILIHYLI